MYDIHINLSPEGYRIEVLRCHSCKTLTPCVRMFMKPIIRQGTRINLKLTLCKQCLGLGKSRIDQWLSES